MIFLSDPIITIDLHGMRSDEAKLLIDRAIRTADGGVYRIRLIHGYNRGSVIRDMIWEEYRYGREPRVISVENGWNEGITELVLRQM